MSTMEILSPICGSRASCRRPVKTSPHRPRSRRPHSADRQILLKALTGLVEFARKPLSGNATYQASGIEPVTLARFAGLILRPVNTGRWAHSIGGRLASLFPTSVKHPERRYV